MLTEVQCNGFAAYQISEIQTAPSFVKQSTDETLRDLINEETLS